MGIYDRDHRQNDPWKNKSQNQRHYEYNEPKNEKGFQSETKKMTDEEIRGYYEHIQNIRNKNNQNPNKKEPEKQKEEEKESNTGSKIITWIIIFIIAVFLFKQTREHQMTEFSVKFIVIGIIGLAVAIVLSIERKKKQKTAYYVKSTNYQKAKRKQEIMEKKFSPVMLVVLSLSTVVLGKVFLYDENNVVQNTVQAPEQENEQEYMDKNHLIKLGNNYLWCEIKNAEDVLPITKALDMGCMDNFCKVEKYFDYVKKIPYEKGTPEHNKGSIEVMKQWKGDCDERSYLLTSMLMANGYKSIILYTSDHAFVAVNIPNYDTQEPRSYFQYRGNKYYWAETTSPNAVIGAYNQVDIKTIKHAYDPYEKREIPLNELNTQIFI